MNVSVEQLIRGDFAARVATSLRSAGLKPDRLELDLDERVLALDSPALAGTLERIAAAGVRLSIDDFGRGLSSIPRLRRYPLAALKLDPELVRGVGRSEDSEAIVEAVGALAGTLGLEIYARGVENRGQQAFLCALDCHLQQGPLFGRPLAAREFAAAIAARGRWRGSGDIPEESRPPALLQGRRGRYPSLTVPRHISAPPPATARVSGRWGAKNLDTRVVDFSPLIPLPCCACT